MAGVFSSSVGSLTGKRRARERERERGEGEEMNFAQEEAEDAEIESEKKKSCMLWGILLREPSSATEFRGSTAPNLLPAGRRSH